MSHVIGKSCVTKLVMAIAAAVAVSNLFSGVSVKSGETIAFFGDSITRLGSARDGGYANLVIRGLNLCGVNVDKIQMETSGDSPEGFLNRVEQDVDSRKLDWMMLSCGMSEIGGGKGVVGLGQLKTNVVAILDKCSMAGVRVVVITPALFGNDRDGQSFDGNGVLEEYAEFLRAEAERRALPFADVISRQRRFLASAHCSRVNQVADGILMDAYVNQIVALSILQSVGMSESELQKCKTDWDLHIKVVPPLGTNRGDLGNTGKCITINMWETLDARAQERGEETTGYIYSKIINRAPDLDWDRNRYETAVPKTERTVGGGFHGRVADLERIDGRTAIGDESAKTWSAVAWKNERVNGQLVLWSAEQLEQVRVHTAALKGRAGVIPRSAVRARFVRYTTASMMHPKEGGPRTQLTGDILDDATSLQMPTNSFRPVWLTIKVPADVAAGVYKGAVEAVAEGGRRIIFPVELSVLDRILPSPCDWKFHLDLWQHPWAVARYHGVKPFSNEHYALMEPLWTELANAGQKTITTTITDLPWNHQSFDAYHSMVRHVRTKNGSFRRDFSLWDEYVSFCERCGMGPQIHCYTMAPWGHIVYWEDEETGDVVKCALKPGTPEHEKFWGAFLSEFRDHVKTQGRLGRVYIALDERSREDLYATAELIKKCGAGLKLGMAGNKKPSEFSGILIDSYCQSIEHITPEYLDEIHATRPSDRFTSAFYVCCGPDRPNTFADSSLAESSWIGLYAAAKRLDGLLRWAYVNWTRDPLVDTTFGLWRPGDTFLMYPGVRASARWEMLRDGIEECEKIRLLREEGRATQRLENALGAIDWSIAHERSDGAIAADVREVFAAVEEASR